MGQALCKNRSVAVSVIIRELPIPEVNEPDRMHLVLPISLSLPKPCLSPVATSHPVPAGSPGSLLPP